MRQVIRSIIVDDEKNGREVLRKLLEKRHPQIEIIGEASNVDEAHQLCVVLKPQLVFLDIQMPKANGFNLLKMFEKIPFEVIFVTSFDQFAITAIKFNALDYILKPIDIQDLERSIVKVVDSIEQKKNNQIQIVNLITSLESDLENKKFAVHNGDKVKIIHSNDVVLINGDGRYCTVILQSGETFMMTKNLKDFEDYFGEKSSFIRISKSQIINAFYIIEYSKGDPFIIQLKNSYHVEVSRRKKPEVLLKLNTNMK